MLRLRKLYIFLSFDHLGDGPSVASALLVLSALPADESVVQLPVDCEGEAIVNQFSSAAVGLQENCFI